MVNLRVDQLQDQDVVAEDTVVLQVFLGQRFLRLHQLFVSVLFLPPQPLQRQLRERNWQDNQRRRNQKSIRELTQPESPGAISLSRRDAENAFSSTDAFMLYHCGEASVTTKFVYS